MTTETIEGTAVEVLSEPTALVVVEQQVERLDETATPEGMVALASRMATALADIVEKKNLYATIQGKKYPQVEAWMTIGRMDNVAAREVRGGVTRVEGGGFEAEVELIRLTDGMTVGFGSAMCGTPGDNPWSGRPVHVQRSMAVTRATSRAFRQRYSWIMALAGYEPTPADEMPGADTQRPVGAYDTAPDRPEMVRTTHESGLVGKVAIGPKGGQNFELQETPDGDFVTSFRLKEGNKVGQIVQAKGPLAEALWVVRDTILGQTCTVWGTYSDESYEKKQADGTFETIRFKVLHLERISTPDFILPAPPDTVSAPMFADDDLSDLPDAWKDTHSEYGEQDHARNPDS